MSDGQPLLTYTCARSCRWLQSLPLPRPVLMHRRQRALATRRLQRNIITPGRLRVIIPCVRAHVEPRSQDGLHPQARECAGHHNALCAFGHARLLGSAAIVATVRPELPRTIMYTLVVRFGALNRRGLWAVVHRILQCERPPRVHVGGSVLLLLYDDRPYWLSVCVWHHTTPYCAMSPPRSAAVGSCLPHLTRHSLHLSSSVLARLPAGVARPDLRRGGRQYLRGHLHLCAAVPRRGRQGAAQGDHGRRRQGGGGAGACPPERRGGGSACRLRTYMPPHVAHIVPPLSPAPSSQAVFKPAEISVRGKGVALALLGSLLLCGLRTGNRQLLNTVIAAIAVGDAV